MSTKKTIAKSFTVSTIEDGVSVQAQYAPNANPTSGQIHTVWQEGDLYMRTRESDESAWSSWHKIVGESGDETDYTFNISKSLTSLSATTAPANCYYNTWQNAPVAPTSTYPYLWMKIVKKTWNESTQSYDSGTARYARVTGEKGENAFVVDLENEMTNVALDENGDLIANFDMYFKVRAYYGTTNVLSDSACSVSASCSDPDVTITDTNAKTTGIRVQISSGTHILDTTEVSVTVTHTTHGTRTVIFTLAGVCGGANAFLQELLPSLDAISFARTAAGGLTPSSRELTLSIKKTQGGSTSTQSLSDSDLTIRWSSTSMPASKTGGNGWGNGTATGISWNNTTMQIANTVAATNIYIAAFNSAGTLVDRETIPVIKDGNNGEDALTLVLDTYAIAFPTDSNYSVESQITYTVGARMYLGNSSIQRTITSLTASLDVADGDIDVSRTSPANGVVIDFGEARFANIIGVNVTAVCAEGTRTAKIILTAAPKGENGTRGKIGRFFYYEGEWNDFASTDSFLVNDAQAPYFYYNNNYWVFNPETNGTYTKQNMGTPSSSSSNWKLMTDDFKYIITEAIFGSYAHFGSAIINGDWMISQHGTINGTASTNYTKFDQDYPNTDHEYQDQSHNFIPNYSVNLLTGETYQNAAHISGNVQATGGYFKGIVAYGSVRTPFVNGDPTWDWDEQDKDICDNFFVTSGGAYSTAYPIPDSASNSGRTLTIVNKSSYAAHLRCENSGKFFVSGSAPSDGVNIPAKTMMQLLGLGTETTFYGWMVINKQTYDFGSIFS